MKAEELMSPQELGEDQDVCEQCGRLLIDKNMNYLIQGPDCFRFLCDECLANRLLDDI